MAGAFVVQRNSFRALLQKGIENGTTKRPWGFTKDHKEHNVLCQHPRGNAKDRKSITSCPARFVVFFVPPKRGARQKGIENGTTKRPWGFTKDHKEHNVLCQHPRGNAKDRKSITSCPARFVVFFVLPK